MTNVDQMLKCIYIPNPNQNDHNEPELQSTMYIVWAHEYSSGCNCHSRIWEAVWNLNEKKYNFLFKLHIFVNFKALCGCWRVEMLFFLRGVVKAGRDAVCSTHDTFHFSHGKRFLQIYFKRHTAMLY